MSLENEIEDASRQVSTDSFSITIGELSNMYADGDIKISPEFQRLYRWDTERKSRLIESILVRIPLPPIFVFELPNSKWEVIDGLQRISTVLEFMGELVGPDGDKVKANALIGTQYLPSLSGAFWNQELLDWQVERDIARKDNKDPTYFDNTSSYHVISSDVQRAIKRTKIGVQLLEKKSDPKSKFDLFQRLNSGGMMANEQELRNSSMVMISSEFFKRLKALAESEKFSKIIPLGAQSISKSNHLDSLSKLFAFTFRDYKEGTDIENYVSTAMLSIAADNARHDEHFEKVEKTLDVLIDAIGYNALRPFKGGQFIGRIGRTSQEIILSGLLYNIDHVSNQPNLSSYVRERIEGFWDSPESRKFSAAGISGTDRVRFTIPFGRELFK